MRALPNMRVEQYRITTGPFGTGMSAGHNGAFMIHTPDNVRLKVICSDGLGWEHVSVSLPDRTPTWAEMCFIKELFWRDDEWVVQYHPPKAEHVNFHPHCLHLWKPRAVMPVPPAILVGPKGDQ